MQYFISFLEGIITFISPCLLPMLPVYISYFAGVDSQTEKYTALKNAIGFVTGFTLVFVIMGAFAGSIGKILNTYANVINIVTGAVVVLFGLNFVGVIKVGLLNNSHKMKKEVQIISFSSSVLFGIVFSIGWTPCIGTFLGSALMLASQRGSVMEGIAMLIVYSLGLGIPFIVSALILDKMKNAFDFIKRNYKIINLVAGIFLIVIGILMMTGYMGIFLSLLS